MRFNPITSKTIIGAVIAIIGHLLGTPELAGYEKELQAVSAIVEGIGAFIAAIGIRHAIAKSSVGISQLHPATMVASLLGALALIAPTMPATLPTPAMTLLVDEWYPNFAGDSLRYILTWKQPPDSAANGKADSTFYTITVSKPFAFFPSSARVANIAHRRKHTTALADSLKLAKPAVGDSVTFQVAGFTQCRKGDCSVPGSAGWKYRRTVAPPAAAPQIRLEEF